LKNENEGERQKTVDPGNRFLDVSKDIFESKEKRCIALMEVGS